MREIFRDRNTVAFLPLQPATLGHTLIVPRTHIRDIWQLDEAMALSLANVTRMLARCVRDASQPEGLNIIQSNGLAASQTIPHLHIHVVPRWAADSIPDFWPHNSHFTARELDDAAEDLRAAVRGRNS